MGVLSARKEEPFVPQLKRKEIILHSGLAGWFEECKLNGDLRERGSNFTLMKAKLGRCCRGRKGRKSMKKKL